MLHLAVRVQMADTELPERLGYIEHSAPVMLLLGGR